MFNLFKELPNEIFTDVLNNLSSVSIGYIRVSKRFHAAAEVIKSKWINSKKFSPFCVYSDRDKENIFRVACKRNNKCTAEYLTKKYSFNPYFGVWNASRYGHNDLIRFLIENRLVSWTEAIFAIINAKSEIRLELVSWCIDQCDINVHRDEILKQLRLFIDYAARCHDLVLIYYFDRKIINLSMNQHLMT